MSIPSNIIDAAAQIKDGTLGVIDLITIGDVQVSALTGLQAPREKDVTRRRVQAGFEVINGMVELSTDLVLDIVLGNPDFSPEAAVTAALTGTFAGFTETWQDKRDSLTALFDTNEIVNVTTHENSYPSRVISRLEPLFDNTENYDCWVGRVTLTPFNNQQLEAVTDVASAMTAAKKSMGGL